MAGGAQAASAAAKAVVQPAFTMQNLWPMALWGTTAATALLVAILATRSDAGSQWPAAAQITQGPSREFDTEAATRQLVQTVRGLSEDRDRLAARLAALEHGLDDITGAIGRRGESATPRADQEANPTTDPKTAKAPPPWPAGDLPKLGMVSPSAVAVPVVPLFAGLPPALPALFSAPTPPQHTPSAPARTPGAAPAEAYGADLGSAVSIQALRARWAGTRSAHPQVFAGLHAVAVLDESPQPKRAALRLVVGPLPSPGAAVELCATLATFRLSCQPTSFAGQHLALQ